MVHFLRDGKNNTLIECEVYDRDLSANIDVENYSNHLLAIRFSDQYSCSSFIDDFRYLSEIRRAWWEDEPGVQGPEEFVAEEFLRVATKWDLNYVVD